MIRRFALILLCVSCALAASGAADGGKQGRGARKAKESAAAKEEGKKAPQVESRLLYRAETVHIGDGRVLEPGEILVEDGRVAAVAVEIPETAWEEGPEPELRDLGGAVLTPGLIDAYATVASGGGNHPEYRVADVVDPYDPLLGHLLRAGVTAALLAPGAGREAGLAAVVRLRDGGLDVLEQRAGLVLTVDGPSADARAAAALNLRRRLHAGEQYAKKWSEYEKEVKEREEKRGSRRGKDKPKRPKHDPGREVWSSVADGSLRLLAGVRTGDGADALGEVLAPRKAPATFVGCEECDAGTGPIRTHVILLPLLSVPHGSDRKARTPALAANLERKEARIAAGTGGEWPASSLWVTTVAAAIASQGVDRADALSAVTGRAAAALGVADRIGLLAPGRHADLVAWDRDPLDPTARVKAVFLDGGLVAWEEPE